MKWMLRTKVIRKFARIKEETYSGLGRCVRHGSHSPTLDHPRYTGYALPADGPTKAWDELFPGAPLLHEGHFPRVGRRAHCAPGYGVRRPEGASAPTV